MYSKKHVRTKKGTLGFLFGTALIALLSVNAALAAAVRPGFDSNMLVPNDDSSIGPVLLGFNANFFGRTFNSTYVNNNGNITFDSQMGTYTPFDLTSTGRQIIAPFFADVDTSAAGSVVTYGTGMIDGRNAFGVNWLDVDYFSSSPSHINRNSFQLVLIDRSDVNPGDFDIEFNYDQIQWEAGTASGSDPDGRGGTPARAGFSNGTGNVGTFFELYGSGIAGAFLDGGPNSLIANSLNSNVDGRYLFAARNGGVSPAPVPLPAGVWLFGSGLFALLGLRRKYKAPTA